MARENTHFTHDLPTVALIAAINSSGLACLAGNPHQVFEAGL